jgi:hypothetical protein
MAVKNFSRSDLMRKITTKIADGFTDPVTLTPWFYDADAARALLRSRAGHVPESSAKPP